MEKIKIEVIINKNIKDVWDKYINPADIKVWCHASDDWDTGEVENDLKIGGRFLTNMHAKDNSQSFDFTGTYLEIKELEYIRYLMDGEDKRICEIFFEKINENETKVTEIFDPENINSRELQISGWQAILNSFKGYVEGK